MTAAVPLVGPRPRSWVELKERWRDLIVGHWNTGEYGGNRPFDDDDFEDEWAGMSAGPWFRSMVESLAEHEWDSELVDTLDEALCVKWAARDALTDPVMAWLLAHGNVYPAEDVAAELWGEPLHCYRNCGEEVRADPSLTYVEGLAIQAEPIEFRYFKPIRHAWLIYADGTVIDPTAECMSYFGVPMSSGYYLDLLDRFGWYSVLEVAALGYDPRAEEAS